jgi:ADP-ribose pyrophosphatase
LIGLDFRETFGYLRASFVSGSTKEPTLKSPYTGQIDSRVVYGGSFFKVRRDRVRLPDGSVGELEIIRHPGAVAVLPVYRPGEWSSGDGAAVVLLRQYRYAADGYVWEVPAGKLDTSEAPEVCARRELEEEAGLRATELQKLTSIYTTPGFTDEQIDIYAATGLSEGRAAPESTEFIETETLPVAEALRLIEEGEIADSKTICSLLWARCFTDLMDG